MPRKPKPADQLAGHSHGRAGAAADRRAGMRTLIAEAVPQPDLWELIGNRNPMTNESWLPQSMDLWEHLGEFPTIAKGLQAAQWDMLARAVALDDASWSEPKWAAEARLRFAKYGIDPDDLLKLRIQIVAADEAEERRRSSKPPPDGSQSMQKFGPLTAV
ncbi:MAG TPA: hypothetical protein VJ777_07105 [Mycobacterium sp.]|nr:hypothetical protein [Mycobacterium sp.]